MPWLLYACVVGCGIRFKGRALFIHNDAFVDNLGSIEIGENVVISTKAILLVHDYSPRIKQMLNGCDFKYIHSRRIDDNVFIGVGAIVLPDSVIGNYCIIGAVVKGIIPDYTVVVGNLCKIIKSIKSK